MVYADPADLREACGPTGSVAAEACASGTDVFAFGAYHPHELVHAYASLLGDPPFFFQEGLALVLGCGEDLGRGAPIARPDDVRPWLTTTGFRSLPTDELLAAYQVAGELTRFLVERYGREPYLAFYASIGRSAALGTIERAFAASFGESLDVALDAYAQSPARSAAELCLHLTECASPEPEPEGAALVCGVGRYPLTQTFPNLPMFVRSLGVSDAEGVRLHGEGLPRVSGSLGPCDGALPAATRFSSVAAATSIEVWMNPPPDAYYLSVWQSPAEPRPDDDAPIGAITVERPALPEPGACDPSGRRVVPAGTTEITVVGDLDWPTAAPLGDGRSRMVFGFELAEDASAEPVVSLTDPPFEGDVAYVCAGGCPEDPAADCADLDLDPAVPYVPFLLDLGAGVPLYVVVDGAPNPRGFTFHLLLTDG